ncbi:unnamed protein product, partial [Medioppia subpectinata]
MEYSMPTSGSQFATKRSPLQPMPKPTSNKEGPPKG